LKWLSDESNRKEKYNPGHSQGIREAGVMVTATGILQFPHSMLNQTAICPDLRCQLLRGTPEAVFLASDL
jgi:hypothetical protein